MFRVHCGFGMNIRKPKDCQEIISPGKPIPKLRGEPSGAGRLSSFCINYACQAVRLPCYMNPTPKARHELASAGRPR